MFGALNVRSHFSIGESLLTIPKAVEAASQCGYKSLALMDTMSVSGMVDFTSQCKKAGIKPIIGVRLRVVADVAERSGKRSKAWYPKLYIKNEDGLKRVFRLLSKANQADHFYYEPRLSFDDVLAELDSEALAFSTGDFYSAFHESDVDATLIQVSARLRASNCFVELCPIDTPLFDSLNMKALRAAGTHGLPTLVTYPALYPDIEAGETLDVLGAIARNGKLKDPWTSKQWVKDFVLHHPKDLLARCQAATKRLWGRYEESPAGFRDGLLNTNALADMVTFEWSKMKPSLPVMAENEFGRLVELCREGWAQRFGRSVFGHTPIIMTEYVERLKYELSVLKKMGFSNYFLLVQDIVAWSKDHGIIVGPGRGSVGGSLVAYLIGITDVDPLRFNLLFERFINPERIDLPDADLDFMSTRRHEVIEYIIGKWGTDYVAGVSNYGTLAAASALRDTSRVMGLDMMEMGATKLVPKEHGKPVSLEDAAKQVAEIDKFRLNHPVIWRHAGRLEGINRSLSRHAAGIVVAGEPLVNRAVVERRSEEATVNWDKRLVEDFGLIKMDVLGLSTLDVLEIARRHIWKRHTKKVDFLDLPLDDAAVLAAFGRGETVGVFQFESGGMRKLLKDLAKVESLTFDDLVAATALYRPGPMDAGLLEQYVNIKQGMAEPTYYHANAKAALEPTFGVVVYQEQVMQLARDMAGFTFPEADHLRKAMGKKDKEKMAAMRDKWVKGCLDKSGIESRQANEIFDQIEVFAGYGFNKSHAVEYSLISYIAMWLKVKYSVEFYAASITVADDDEKMRGLILDARHRGVKVLPPDINYSTGQFEILNDTTLLIPFNKVKGISDNTTNAILEARAKAPGGKFASKAQLESLVERRKCNVRHMGNLEKVGAFANIEAGSLSPTHVDRLKDQLELLPGLVIDLVKSENVIEVNDFMKAKLIGVIESYRACMNCKLGGGCHPRPSLGKGAKFVIVTDSPNWSEEKHDQIGKGGGFEYLSEAMHTAGFTKADAYLTTLIKAMKPEGEKMFPTDVINACDWLEKELAIIKPPVIVALGSLSARNFVKGIKGGMVEHAGKVVYDKVRDCNIVIGITPGMVAFDPGKQRILNDIMVKVAELIG